VVTAIDGYQMARKGRAGAALAAAGLGSFFAGCVGTIIIAAFAPPLTELAFKFGPAEYFSLMVLGLIGAVVLASGSLVKAIAMIMLGLLLGPDQHRRDLRRAALQLRHPRADRRHRLRGHRDGCVRLRRDHRQPQPPGRAPRGVHQGREGPVADQGRTSRTPAPAVLRGTALGSMLGILPGGGALLSSFAAYTLEKKMRGRPGEVPFGQGNIRGVAGPEAANNAGAQTSFIPMLTLGIPPNAVMALMVGAMTIKGIQPGPQVMTSNPELFWGLIASMWVGNLMLIILNLPLIGIWIKLLTVPYRFLFPAIVCLLLHRPVHAEQQQFRRVHDGHLRGVGYVFYKLGCEPAPLLLGFILGPMMEENLRRALLLSRGRLVHLRHAAAVGVAAGGGGADDRGGDAAVHPRKREEAFQDAD
jgi:putative tricarboxylic transport membrane protein